MNTNDPVKKLIRENLQTSRMMQIATVDGDQPWICTVYFVADDEMNLYWLSLPTRRHSQEIAKHNKIAVAIPVKFDAQPIIGMQAEGVASEVTEREEVEKSAVLYVAKYDVGKDFYKNFVEGKNQHHMYKFSPKKFVLFDEVNFPDNGRQEIEC